MNSNLNVNKISCRPLRGALSRTRNTVELDAEVPAGSRKDVVRGKPLKSRGGQPVNRSLAVLRERVVNHETLAVRIPNNGRPSLVWRIRAPLGMYGHSPRFCFRSVVAMMTEFCVVSLWKTSSKQYFPSGDVLPGISFPCCIFSGKTLSARTSDTTVKKTKAMIL